MTATEKEIVQTTFAKVAPIADQAATLFYDRPVRDGPVAEAAVQGATCASRARS
jgi:hypothetical protein